MRLLTLLLVLTGLTLSACPSSKEPQNSKNHAELIRVTPELIAKGGLQVAVAGPIQLRQPVSLEGEITLIDDRVASIVAPHKGVIKEVHANLGDKVAKGDKVATLESRDLADALATYVEALQHLELIRKSIAREEALSERSVTSWEQYQADRQNLEVVKLELDAALQRLKLLGCSDERLQALEKRQGSASGPEGSPVVEPNVLEATFAIEAPITGEIVKRDVILGEVPSEGKALFVVADLSQLWVVFQASPVLLTGVRNGETLHVCSEAGDTETEATIVYISPLVDTSTGKVTVHAQIDNTMGAWRPGMRVSIAIKADEVTMPVGVPLVAVHKIEGRDSVFVESGEGTFEVRPVTTGDGDAMVVEIKEGLKAGERVATVNSGLLTGAWKSSSSTSR